jgi:putative hemolysin
MRLPILLVLVFSSAAFAADPTTAASDYCVSTGGQVFLREAVYGTNDFPSALFLADIKPFCQYTSPTDGSRIDVLLETLYTTKPTLAVLAYNAKPATGSCEGNPASCYCSLLGGSDLFGGINAAGGGWVNPNSVDVTLEACIFPDMSSIDSWGLAYHANGIIRGIDLSTVLRYQQ